MGYPNVLDFYGIPFYFRKGGLKEDSPVDLVLSCVDNFEARMAINTVSISVLILSFWTDMHTYEPRHEKMCLREFLTRPDTNQPAQPQKLARVLKFWL